MFSGSQQSGVSDLLLGAGGFNGSLANGFGNDAPSSSAAPGGPPSGSNAFDLNDFPSLGGSASGGSSGNNSGNGLAAALRQQQQQQQQQQILAHQQMLQGGGKQQSNLYRLAMGGGSNGGANFNMATEDFPALPGAPPTVGNGGNGGSGPSSSPLLMGGTNSGVNSSQGGVGFGQASSRAPNSIYGSEVEGGSGAPSSNGVGSQLEGPGLLVGGSLGLGGLAGLQNVGNQSSHLNLQPSRGTASSAGSSNIGGSVAAAGSALSGDFGLLGLLGVIRMTDADRNALALGSDLTMLGLNLGSSEQIFNTFAGPFSDSSGSTKEPHFQLPSCYYMQPPALKTGHLSKFQLETLFYIFYALPKDVLQAYAAQELYSREWRYHGDLKLWFRLAGPADGVSSSSTSPQYLYFDINSWERRLFNGNMNQNVTSGFLTEEDARVKFSSS